MAQQQKADPKFSGQMVVNKSLIEKAVNENQKEVEQKAKSDADYKLTINAQLNKLKMMKKADPTSLPPKAGEKIRVD